MTTQQSSYLGVRADMLAMLPARPFSTVLDVGCASGATSTELKRSGARVTGIEYSAEGAAASSEVLDEVLHGDAAVHLSALVAQRRTFDLALCGDVLEHLLDPWTALTQIRQLVPEGYVVISLPNVAHVSTFFALAMGHWPYRDRGIHDRTHLRFFGRRDLAELYSQAGFSEVRRRVHHRIIERPHWLNQRSEWLVSRIPVVRRFTEYQFVSLLR